MPDPNGSSEIRIGRLEGEVAAMRRQQDGIDRKLDQVLEEILRRRGAEEQAGKDETRLARRHDRRIALVSGIAAGGGVTAFEWFGKKLGMW